MAEDPYNPQAPGSVPPPLAAGTAPPPPSWWNYPPPWWSQPPRRPSFIRRFFRSLLVVLFVLSVLLNFYLLAAVGARYGSELDKSTLRQGKMDQVLAIYEVRGVIDSSAARDFVKFSREMRNDSSIKAVLLRVDSPGGEVSAADEMYSEIKRIREAGKVVTVSMGGVAASGGYYISAPADEIWAEPTTITGSIGVIMTWPVIKKTLDNIGVDMVVLKSSDARGWKDELSGLKQPDERQKQHLQTLLDDMQKRFETVVKDGRSTKLKTRQVTVETSPATQPESSSYADTTRPSRYVETEPLNGKIYLADDAKQLGLIDDIGYQPAVVERTQKLAKLSDPTIVQYKARKNVFTALMGGEEQSRMGLNTMTLDKLQTPRILMMWKAD